MTDIRRYEVLDSTNDEARRLGLAGERGPLWIVAASQSAGKGRRGRQWISAPGNLFASLLLEPDSPLRICGQLSFIAALAVGDLVAEYVSDTRICLKWPNDVLLDGKKVAGILLEAAPAGTASRIIVGCGVNLAHHPRKTDFPAISLAAILDNPPDPQTALLRLVAAWDTWYEVWRIGGFEPIRAAWLARAGGLGENLAVRLADSEIQGVFESLADDGGLLLRLPDGGLKCITAGEVFSPS